MGARKFFERNGEDGLIGDGEGAAHGASLGVTAESVDEAFAVEWLNIVEYDSDAGAGGFQNFQERRNFCGKPRSDQASAVY